MLDLAVLYLLTTSVDASAPAAAAKPPPCRTAHVVLAEPLDSSTAFVGETFTFTIADVDPSASPASPSVVAGATGYGVVTLARKAGAGGATGALTLETRFVLAADGTHVSAPLARPDGAHYEGKARNAPSALGLLPFVSLASSNYNALHHGTDAHVNPGEKIRVAIGDDAITGACLVSDEQAQAAR